MMSFSAEEIFLSVILFLAYGAAFAVLFCLMILAKGLVSLIIERAREILGSERLFSLPKYKYIRIQHNMGVTLTVMCVFLFTVGFCLASYLALDGELRLYGFILAFAAFYLSKFAFYGIFEKAFTIAFDFMFIGLLLFLQIIITPFKLLVSRIKTSMLKKRARN